LLQDFKIGCIDGVINDEAGNEKEPKDIFSKIARAIGKRKSTVKVNPNASTKKDWNAIAQRKNSRRDPIGNVEEREKRRSSQKSIRSCIGEKDAKDPEKLLEYNPNLIDMTPTARVAYAKFKTRKLRREKEFHDKLNEEPEEEDESGNKKSKNLKNNGMCSIQIQVSYNTLFLKNLLELNIKFKPFNMFLITFNTTYF
jgi:transient receptor potential cation channel subfamily C